MYTKLIQFIFLLLIILLILSCNRDFENPLDSKSVVEPDAPTGLSILMNADGNIKLNWTDNGIDNGFTILRGSTIIGITVRNDTTYIDSTFEFEKNYNYSVRSILPNGKSSVANTQSFSTSFAPTQLALSQVTDSNIELSWVDNSIFEDGFIIERKVIGANFSAIDTLTADTTIYVDNGLSNLIQYKYRVKAISGNKSSIYSNEQSLQTNFPEPTELSLLLLSDTECQLTWSDNTNFEEGFIIERNESNTSFVEIVNIPSNSTSYIDQNLNDGLLYIYRIKAYNGNNSSNYSSQKSIISPLSSPTNLEAEVIDIELLLSWDDNSNNEYYYQLERQIGTDDFELYEILNPNTNFKSIDLTNVDPNYIYSFRVKAVKDTLESLHTNIAGIEFGSVLWSKSFGGSVESIKLHPNGKELLVGIDLNDVKIIRIEDGYIISTLNNNYAYSVNYNSTGEKAVFMGNDQISVWDLNSETQIWEGTQTNGLSPVQFSPDNTKIISGGDYGGVGSVNVWNADNGSLIWSKSHDSNLTSIAVSLDGNYVATGSYDNTSKVWDMANGQQILNIQHGFMVTGLAFTSDSGILISCAYDGEVKALNVVTGDLLWSETLNYDLNHLTLQPSSDLFAVSSSTELTVLNSITWNQLWVGSHDENISFSEIDPNGKYVITTGNNYKKVKLWDQNNGNYIWAKIYTGDVRSMLFTSDGSKMITGHFDNKLIAHNLKWTSF